MQDHSKSNHYLKLRARYAQGGTIDGLMADIREVISLCLEESQGQDMVFPEFFETYRS